MGKIYVGMSGWQFAAWRGGFYPKGLVQKRELEYASRQVTSIEINGTFYSLQKPASFQNWFDQTPEDFRFALKGPQYITHVRRLKDVTDPTANFFASGVLCLKDKLGPILWQFPPNVMLKDKRFEEFMKILPHDSKAASRLAKKHTSKVEGRNHTEASGDYPIRHAFEFRHPSFMNPEFLSLMRQNGIAVVFAHSGLKSPYVEDVTADFIYARMHGQEKEYKKGYPKPTIAWWADRIVQWSKGSQPKDAKCVLPEAAPKRTRDVFVYFDTEAKDYAPLDAQNLIAALKQPKPRKKQSA